MGRDVTLVSTHEFIIGSGIRSIIDADVKIDVAKSTVRFRLKPHKVLLFSTDTEKRIPFTTQVSHA